MKKTTLVVTILLSAALLLPADLFGRGFGGGRGGGGGGYRGGGGARPSMGGGARPNMGGARPNMGGSRPQMGGGRPQMGGGRPQMGARPQMSRPGGQAGSFSRPGAGGPGFSGGNRPNISPGARPGMNPGMANRPGARPGGIQNPNIANRPGVRPGAGGGGIQNPNLRPGTRPGAGGSGIQNPNIANRPGVRPGAGGGGIQNPNLRPGTRPGAGGGGIQNPNIANRPGVRPGAGGSGTQNPIIANRPNFPGGNTRPAIRPGQGGSGEQWTRPGNRPGWNNGNRPNWNNGNRPGWADNRPGNRPGWNNNRPWDNNRPGWNNNRPWDNNRPWNNNRPGWNQIGNNVNINNIHNNNNFISNRPWNDNWRHGNWNNGNWNNWGHWNNWNGNGWGNGGWWNGYANGFASGYNTGYWDRPWYSRPLAWGLGAWTMGSIFYNSGYAAFNNPYYVAPAVATPIYYDYSQPIQVVSTSYELPADTSVAATDPATAEAVAEQTPAIPPELQESLEHSDLARNKFYEGDYDGAMKELDLALEKQPNDAALHELRALIQFAQQDYKSAAGTLYAVLSAGPGWDWTTLSSLYPSIDVYTQQVRALEQYVRANPDDPAGRFVLAYHYVTQKHNEAAVKQYKEIVRLQPSDQLSARLIKVFGGEEEQQTAGEPPTPEDPAAEDKAPDFPDVDPKKIVGNWTAKRDDGTTFKLNLTDDDKFTWEFEPKNRKGGEFDGKFDVDGPILVLTREDGSQMPGLVTLNDDGFNFKLYGGPENDPGLDFRK